MEDKAELTLVGIDTWRDAFIGKDYSVFAVEHDDVDERTRVITISEDCTVNDRFRGPIYVQQGQRILRVGYHVDVPRNTLKDTNKVWFLVLDEDPSVVAITRLFDLLESDRKRVESKAKVLWEEHYKKAEAPQDYHLRPLAEVAVPQALDIPTFVSYSNNEAFYEEDEATTPENYTAPLHYDLPYTDEAV